MVAIAIATAAALGAGVGPASAAPTPEPTPSRPLVAATTMTLAPSTFSPTGYTTITGTRQAGSVVTVTSGSTIVCSAPATESTEWSCGSVALPDGAGIDVTATETPRDPSVPAPSGATTTIDVLRPPVLDGTGGYITTGIVSGTGRPGALVTVSVDGAPDASCTSLPVASSSYWSCGLARPSGRFIIRAQQSDSRIAGGSLSAYSNAQDVMVDRDAPASAAITSPRDGTRTDASTVAVTGTGEDGATVDVYLDNVPTCATTAVGGAWSCTVGGFARGSHTLQAVIRDIAGNYASPSGVIRFSSISVATAPATPAPVAPAEPGTPAPPATPQPIAPSEESPAPIDPAPSPTQPEALSNWSVPTGFGSGLGSLSESFADRWYTAPLIGLLFLALVALPLRLMATSLRGRIRSTPRRFTGRNRPHARRTTDAQTGTAVWRTALLPLVITAALIAVSVGVDGEVRYLRLYLAIGIGLVLLNVAGAIASWSASRWTGAVGRLRFLPLMLLGAVVTALVSRFAGLEPPMITGVLVGTGFALGIPAMQRAIAGLAQVGAVTVIGLLGWVGFETVGTGGGFWPVVTSETLATVCLAGLGSALLLVLPIASLPGRAILEWSRPAWAVTTAVVSTVVAGVVFGNAEQLVQLAPWMLAAAAFAALSVAVWAYVRFVEPQAQA